MMNDDMKCLIMIAAYNEEENLEKVVGNLIANYPQYDYVVINDGSTDATAQICERNHYSHINLPMNLGIGGAIQTGYLYACNNGYDIAIQLDGDGQHDPAYIEDLIKPIMEDQADYVIGSRFINHEGFQTSGMRRAGIVFLSGLIRILCFKKVRDVTSGFRAVNRKFVEKFSMNYPPDYPEPEAIMDAVMNRGRIVEIPVIMHERAGGKSSINIRRSIYYMIKVSLDIFICRISYGFRR